MSTALLVLLVAVLIGVSRRGGLRVPGQDRRAQVMTRAGVGGAASVKIPLIAKPDGGDA